MVRESMTETAKCSMHVGWQMHRTDAEEIDDAVSLINESFISLQCALRPSVCLFEPRGML